MKRLIFSLATVSILAAGCLTAQAAGTAAQPQSRGLSPLAMVSLRSPGDQDKRRRDIIGTWVATYTINGNTVAQTFAQWSKGGSTVQENTAPPDTGNFIMGKWSSSSETVTSSYIGWGYDSGTVSGYFTKDESVTVSGDAYSGTFEVKIYDLDGNLLADHTGNVSASRVY